MKLRLPLLLSALLLVSLAGPVTSHAEGGVAVQRAWRQATSLIEQGMPRAAMEPMRKAAELAPGDIRIQCDYQDLMKGQGYEVDVIEAYRTRRDRNPQDPDALYLYGRVTGDPKVARSEFEQAIAIDPGHIWATQGLGGVAAVEGKLDEALEHYRAALELDPSFADVHNKMAGIHYARGSIDDAIASWRAAMQHAPDDYHAYLNMGAVLSMQGDLEGASELLAKAVERAPGNPLAYVNHGYVLFKLKRYDEALSNFAAALAINPRDRRVAGSRDLVQQVQDGRIPFEAFAPYEQALAKLGTDPAAAIQHFKEVLILAPDFAVAHMNLGLLYFATGETDAGLSSLRKAVELSPDDPAARYNLGYVLLGMEEIGEARTHLERAHAIDGQDVDILSALALTQLGIGEVGKAARLFKKATELQPRDPVLWLQYGSALAAQGDLDSAAESAHKALTIAPGFTSARIQLVAILREARRYDEALAELEPLQALAPDHPDLASERASLEAALQAQQEAASQPGHVRLSRIYTTDASAAERVASKLSSGSSFEALARTFGEGPERVRSGDIGFIDPADLRAELASAVQALKVGETTEVVELGGSWVVLKRTR